MIIISMSNRIGETLGQRSAAAQLREEIIRLNQSVQLDFSGVKIISYSFADELLGEVVRRYGPDVFRTRIFLRNIRPDSRSIIRSVVHRQFDKTQ